MEINIDGECFNNVFIYISDALRYDSISDTVATHGRVVKTASSGLATPESVSSLLTGVYPSQHGVWQFSSELSPELKTIFDINPEQYLGLGYNGDVLRNMLGYPDIDEVPLEDLSEPFVYVVKDDLAHSPYGHSLENSDSEFSSHDAYWRERATSRSQIQEDYEIGVEKSSNRFNQMLDSLDDLGLLEETLVIYTGDHGELLGEHGLVDHGVPVRPELVYVPTVFCNERVSVEGEFMAHVDLFPTILDALNKNLSAKSHGYNLIEGAPEDRLALNEVERPFYTSVSVWDKNGGITFTNDSLLKRGRLSLQHLKGRGTSAFIQRHPIEATREFLARNRIFGTPSFTRTEAEKFRQKMSQESASIKRELDEEGISRLEDLGYLEGDEL